MILNVDNLYFHCIQLIDIQHLDHHVNLMGIYRMHDVHSLYIEHLNHKHLVNHMDFYILHLCKRQCLDNQYLLNILLDFGNQY